MTGVGPFDHDPFAMAVVLAVVTGLVSIEDPALAPLTLTLVALGVASRLVHVRAITRPRGSAREELAAMSVVPLAVLFYALTPPTLADFRGILLATSLLPLWWTVRHPRDVPEAVR